MLWELIKINVKEWSIQYCKKAKKKIVQQETRLETEIDDIEERLEAMETDNTESNALIKERCNLESELNELYEMKIRGAQIRPRAEWVENGERSSKYFLGLEKQRQCNNVINKLQNKDGNIVYNENDIKEEITHFYSKLYNTTKVDDEKKICT